MRFSKQSLVLGAAMFVPAAFYVWHDSAGIPAKAVSAAKAAKAQPKIPAIAAAPMMAAPKPLPVRPETVKAVYFTEWSAGLSRRVDYLADLKKSTEVNAVVIDIKDYSGYIAYRTTLADAVRYKATRRAIRDIDALVSRLHAEGLYAIARITCFQDPVLAAARPDLAVRRDDGDVWVDRKGLAWLDPASRAGWEYIAAVGKDALAHGFDELNFDYVRFPSDGNLKTAKYPVWDGKTPKHQVIRQFFAYLRKQLPGVPISADLFGLATVNDDDLGIGQVIEDAYGDFDAVCPMIYPSHFARQFLGFANPAEHPYDVVHYSMQRAIERLRELRQPPAGPAQPGAKPAPQREIKAKLRPWLQDFNLGAKYDARMVKAQIRAVQDALGKDYAGYMIWSPSNVYTRAALEGAREEEKSAAP